ncbi:TetR family transcriptional regulator [uncultured Dialister sp.]|uniref:TetR family transcriptional regulator n=1 Tax=uncultured Dialister sp. TaxID=278064 RepID=UPI0026DC3F93|nr:TetR family transcriptional regulator [uncultured Dialister sp.]
MRTMALDKKERIGRAAARLFKEKGYTGTSLRDISREAKVNVSSISYYFGTKEALYRELFPEGEKDKEPDTKEQIENAAIRLFAFRGYSDVSIRDIGKEAGVNSAAISYYFGGKKELYASILERGSALLVDFVESTADGSHSPTEIMEMYSHFFFRLMKEHPYILRIFSWEMIHPTEVFASIGKERFAMVLVVLRAALTEGMEQGCFRKDLKPTEVCISWAGMVAYYYLMNEIKKRFDVKEDISEASYMNQAYDVLMNGIRAKKK